MGTEGYEGQQASVQPPRTDFLLSKGLRLINYGTEPGDAEEGVRCIQEAADRGYSKALLTLAAIYFRGQLVPQDTARAMGYLEQAAATGDLEAMYQLGEQYDEGDYIPLDVVKAAEWYRKAAELGYAEAQAKMGVAYYRGRGVQQDLEKSAVWFRKAARQNTRTAQVYLRDMYLGGYGVKKNVDDAIYWGDLADETNSPLEHDHWMAQRQKLLREKEADVQKAAEEERQRQEEIAKAAENEERRKRMAAARAKEEEERKLKEAEEEKYGITSEMTGVFSAVLFIACVFAHLWAELHINAPWLLRIPAMGLGAIGAVVLGGVMLLMFGSSYTKSDILPILFGIGGLAGGFMTVFRYKNPVIRKYAVIAALVVMVLLLIKAAVKKSRKPESL